MRRLVDRMQTTAPDGDDTQRWLDEEYSGAARYASERKQYIAEGRGTPPNAG